MPLSSVEDSTQLRQARINSVLAYAEKARRRLAPFCSFTDPTYRFPKHIALTIDALEKLERGEIRRLMVFWPPRHGKSHLCSIKFPSWCLGRNPDRPIIHSSYALSLSRNFSRKTRAVVEGNEFGLVFPTVKTSRDSRSVDNWEIDGFKGGMIASGAGGSITGHGAGIFIIDDPIKNRQEADSEVIQEKLFDWYRNVALTRLEPNGAMLLMLTRWNKNDLAGRILETEKDWVVLNIPALIETEKQEKDDLIGRKIGDALWPERYPAEELQKIRSKSGGRAWSALYQGNPLDESNRIIRRDWIRWYDELPPETSRGGGIDTATSLKTTADRMAFDEVCKDKEGFLYVDDVLCERLTVQAFSSFYVNRVKTRPFAATKIEENAAGEAIRQVIVTDCRKNGASPHPEGFKTSTDKAVRVSEFSAMIENGTIKFKRGNKKVEELVEHLIDFPQGAIDDDVDALGFAIKAVNNNSGANIRWL